MRILHYILGLPPYRTGGLTKFTFDLMREQCIMGDEAICLWPGQIKFVGKQNDISIKRRKDVTFPELDDDSIAVENYELINPLPVPLDEGIVKPEYYMKNADVAVYEKFLIMANPGMIHVHTMMGIHEAFFIAAKKLGIKIIFTTHDYFGICNKVYLFDKIGDGNSCSPNEDCRKCAICNTTGLSFNKVRILQSSLYRDLKDSYLVKHLRKKHRSEYFDAGDELGTEHYRVDEKSVEEYKKLRKFYKKLFSYIDYFHFTSSVSEKVYRQFLPNIKGELITITHRDISDNRQKRTCNSGKIRYTMLAPAKPYKGFGIVKNVMDEMWYLGKRDFLLRLYCPVGETAPYMKIKETGYDYKELAGIFDKTDVLLAPSVWFETFGYTVLEAISYGIPVIITDRVGAGDIIGGGGKIITGKDTKELTKQLKETLNNLDAETINSWNQNIVSEAKIKDWRQFVEEVKAWMLML